MSELLRYVSKDDKCYGATGMAIGVVVCDRENMLSSVSLDAEPDMMIDFVNEFYFAGDPGISAKSAWHKIERNFVTLMVMSISNLMCRHMVLNHRNLSDQLRSELRDLVIEEGRESCSLDDDETTRLFEKNYSYLYRVFNHPGVHSVANDFARQLKARRRLSRNEVIELLMALSRM